MAGNAVIGALRVVLGADTAAFESGLKSAQSKLDSFGTGMAKAGAAMAAGFVAATAALGIAVKGAINEADKLGKLAQSIGLPVEELSKLKHAADLSDISMESFGKSMVKLSKAMVETAGGGAGPAKQAFEALGVSVRNADGTLRSSSDVLGDVAEKFSGFHDSAAKTTLSVALFGKAGATMIPMLNAGRDGLREAADEAKLLGIVLDGKTSKAAEAFNDNMLRMGKIWDGIILQVVAKLAPGLEVLSQSLFDVTKNSGLLEAASNAIISTFEFMSRAALATSFFFRRLGIELEAFWRAATATNWSDMKAGFSEFVRIGDETKSKFDELKESSRVFWANVRNPGEVSAIIADLQSISKEVAALGAEYVKTNAPIIQASTTSANALNQFLNSTQKSTAAQQAELQTIGMASGAKEALRIKLEALTIAQQNNIPITEALRLKIEQASAAAGDMGLKIAGANLVQANLAPHELYRQELEKNRLAMVAAKATADELARGQEKVAEQFGMSWGAIGTNIASTAGAMSNLAGTFAKENKAMGVASKAFGITQAIINTQIAITKALASLPPPASYAAVALAVASGAAAVATIASQGFAKGGSFTVPGGLSGTDNMMMPLGLASGERVTVETPEEVRRGGRGGASEIKVGMRLRDFMTGENLRDMVEALNAGRPDGYKLVFDN